jgi:hypothetical protein
MIVEVTNYYPRQGGLDAVLARRRRATAIRVALGLPPGRIMVRQEGEGPLVRWECTFADAAAYAADRKARAGNPDFEASRKEMLALLERFERQVYEVVPDAA